MHTSHHQPRNTCAHSRRSTTRNFRLAATAALASLITLAAAGCSLPVPPVWVTENLDKCQKGIEGEASKLDKKLFSVLKKCKDAYRKAILKSEPLAIKAAPTCANALGKVMTFPDPEGKSALAKTKAKLDKLTFPSRTKCTDENLVALGHLPTAALGDTWARLLMVQRIKAAFENQAAAIADTANIFSELAAAGCTGCSAFAAPPCDRRVCSGTFDFEVENLGLSDSVNTLIPMDMCSNSGILGSDMAIVGGQDVHLAAIDFGGGTGQTACVYARRIHGMRHGAASIWAAQDVKTCQDHINDDGNECPGICSTPQPDSQHAAINGGVCIDFSSAGSANEGDSVLMANAQLALVCDGVGCAPDTRGPDGIPCTADDTATAINFPVALTTSSSQAQIADADNTDGASILSTLDTGTELDFTSGPGLDGTLVGSLPGLHVIENSPSPDADDVVRIEVDCSF